jgi:hypothetical protein
MGLDERFHPEMVVHRGDHVPAIILDPGSIEGAQRAVVGADLHIHFRKDM